MWLTSSSIGRKFVMAVTGCCLVLFVTFHVLMNAVAIAWPAAYNMVCEFLGSNWYALVASAGLALLFIIHIIYAVWLTLQNYKARGNDRYDIAGKAPGVEWSSKNMLVLGIVVLAFLAVHLIQFWAKMQWQELRHADLAVLPQLNEVPASPAMGTLFLQMAFSQWYTPVIYIIGFVALWFHMNHGFWSMLHTVGWNNNIWMSRIKKIGCWWTSIVVVLFTAQAIVFTVQAHNNFYTTNEALQDQYAEFWDEQATDLIEDFQYNANKTFKALGENPDPIVAQKAESDFIANYGASFVERAALISDSFTKQCPDVMPTDMLRQMSMLKANIERSLERTQFVQPQQPSAANPAEGAAEQANDNE